MYDAVAIEAINFEQLVTRTDRLLLHRGRLPKHRASTQRIGPVPEQPTMFVRIPSALRITTVALALIALGLFIATLA